MKLVKLIKYSLSLLVLSTFMACSDDKDPVTPAENKDPQPAAIISNDQHTIELFTANGRFQTGYNAVSFRIKNKEGALVENAAVTWAPLMHMTSMSHACPASAVSKKPGDGSAYEGFIVFQMAGNETEYWELSFAYTVDGSAYAATGRIQVTAAPKRVVESFQGSDSKRYILALVEPVQPKVAVNDIKAVLYRMESMMSFVPVNNYKILVDPRMPGMGNHGSPNNQDLVQGADKLYHGKVSLTMTGYWKINLRVEDDTQTMLKGEPVTETNEASSIYFELEF